MQISEVTTQGSQHQIFDVEGTPIEYLVLIAALLNGLGANLQQSGATLNMTITTSVLIAGGAGKP